MAAYVNGALSPDFFANSMTGCRLPVASPADMKVDPLSSRLKHKNVFSRDELHGGRWRAGW
jgi:hypothetical protein